MLRGDEMDSYLASFLTADQRDFATGMLALRAGPRRSSFVAPELCERCRPSLGPGDAFSKETSEILQSDSLTA